MKLENVFWGLQKIQQHHLDINLALKFFIFHLLKVMLLGYN